MHEMKFVDDSEYEKLVKTGECIRNKLHSLSTLHNREIVIIRMYVEKGFIRFCFSVDGVKYLITANITQKTNWTIQSNKWSSGSEPIEPHDIVTGAFIKVTDHH